MGKSPAEPEKANLSVSARPGSVLVLVLDRTRCNCVPAKAKHSSEKHIAGCLQSVAKQSRLINLAGQARLIDTAGQVFKNIGHIVIDGGSKDKTL